MQQKLQNLSFLVKKRIIILISFKINKETIITRFLYYFIYIDLEQKHYICHTKYKK